MLRTTIFVVLFIALFVFVPATFASYENDDLCTPSYQLAHLGQCPLNGPGGRVEMMQRFELPEDLPAANIQSLKTPPPLANKNYARVIKPNAPIYASVDDALANKEKRKSGKGFIYVTYDYPITRNGEDFFQINVGEFIRRADIATITPSKFEGVVVTRQPERPFGWILAAVQPRLSPSQFGLLNLDVPKLNRYDIVQIYDRLKVGNKEWLLIGRNQWIEHDPYYIALVEIQPMPPQVLGKWIAVNLYEQTMSVYENERMVYATLVSSGIGVWNTRPGIFQVYEKFESTPMTGAFAADASDYYSLEDVPWTMYFDKSIALHGAYWHDLFGYQQSHGCVNLAPKDSLWLYKWAELGTIVYVYDPSGRTPTTSFGGGP
jgi:hypothetical protein